MVHRYSNGEVDGELSVHVPRGTSVEEMYEQIMEAFGQTYGNLGDGYWLSLGQRFTIEEDDEVYRRNRGMNELSTYYSNMRRSGIVAATFGVARDMMTPGAYKKYGRKATLVFVRVHWNPWKKQPDR